MFTARFLTGPVCNVPQPASNTESRAGMYPVAGPPCWRPLLFDGSRMKEPPPSLVTHYALLHGERNGYDRSKHPDDTDAADAFEKAWTSADVPAHEQREIEQWEKEGRKVAERLRAAEQAEQARRAERAKDPNPFGKADAP